MKEHPILMNAAMVRATLAGTKTQTRRTRGLDGLNEDPNRWASPVFCTSRKRWVISAEHGPSQQVIFDCPFGVPGDRLWVREIVRKGDACARFAADGEPVTGLPFWPWNRDVLPSIHMPRIASRITLEVTGVRVERLQKISEADAKAEGVVRESLLSDPDNFHPPGSYGYVPGHLPFPQGRIHVTAKEAYQDLWESINGPGSWSANPWVWVVEFKRTEAKP